MWTQRMEAALAASEQDRQAAQRSWEASATERQALAAHELAEARQAGQVAVAEAQAGWAARLAAEEKRWLEVGGMCACPVSNLQQRHLRCCWASSPSPSSASTTVAVWPGTGLGAVLLGLPTRAAG